MSHLLYYSWFSLKSKELRFIVHKWLVLAATAITLCSSSGCSDRERLNPIDPLNPKTGGKPVGLFAVSMRDTVRLTWQPLGLRNLSGYRIYRQSNTGRTFTRIDSVGGDQHSYREFGLTLGRRYVYRITAYTEVNESSPSDTVGITPGPAFIWVADAGFGDVIKLTHDGRQELFRARGFIRPERLQANPKTGEVWVIDTITDELRRIDANGTTSAVRVALQRPVDVTLDTTENSVWVADEDAGVFKYDARGVRLLQAPSSGVNAIAFNYYTNEVWALARKRRKLLRIDRNGLVNEENVSLASPQAISIHRGTGDAWIADSSRVIVVRGTGQIDVASGHSFIYAKRLAVNQNSGECWVIDAALRLPPSRLVKFDVSGTAQFSLGDFYSPSGISINVFDGSCFMTEPQLSSLIHVSATGQILNRASTFSRPFDVDVENRPLN